MTVVKEDVGRVAGNLELCAGQQAIGKAAIHAMGETSKKDNCEVVLVVDAQNAFDI